MSGNRSLDQQIAQAMMPRYNPNQAIQQMQRQPVQIQPWQARAVQNPIFGGAIPMNFGLPQASQVPIGYQSPLAQFRPSAPAFYAPPPAVEAAPVGDSWSSSMGWNPNGVYAQGHGGAN